MIKKMEGILMIPKLFINSEEEDSSIKDFVLYIFVFGLHKVGIYLPRKLFIFFVIYVLVCEIINNSTYKIIPPNKHLVKNWVEFQNDKNIQSVLEYLKS
jgi:hypothetical protein